MSDELVIRATKGRANLRDYFSNKYQGSMLVVDRNEQITNCNDVFYKCLGYSDINEVKGKKLQEVIGLGVTIMGLFKQYNSYTGEGAPFIELELDRDVRLGSSYSIYPIYQPSEDTESYYMLILHDIHLSHNLSLLQQFSGTFMEDVNMGVILINMDFTLIDISDMACRILGVAKQKVINKEMDEVFSSVPLEHQLVQRTILDGQIVRNHAISWTNNQERYELLMDSNILKDDQGRTVGAYVIFKDVSNLRSLEEQVQRSDRLAMIGQIAAGTAHEIRNPLTSIKGFLQVLKKKLHANEMDKEVEYTEIMLTEIDRINELVSEFLLLSKPKNITYNTVVISEVLKEILPIINNEAILHGVTVQYECAPNMPQVVADRELLKQVCLNIGKNGIEAMVDGGILSLVERVDSEEQIVNIEIHDSGPGIPAFLIDKIFDPFFTTKENGTGLGLSVCQRIIHDIGGTIRVSSKGFGTTFTISIPYAKVV